MSGPWAARRFFTDSETARLVAANGELVATLKGVRPYNSLAARCPVP
jgi:hypothetical protein